MIDFKIMRCWIMPEIFTLQWDGQLQGKGKKCEDFEQAVRVFSCCAGAAIYRMDVLKKIGGLDEQHFAYLEDIDVGYRARIAGV